MLWKNLERIRKAEKPLEGELVPWRSIKPLVCPPYKYGSRLRQARAANTTISSDLLPSVCSDRSTTMSIIPRLFSGRRSGDAFDPFSLDVFPFGSSALSAPSLSFDSDVSAFADTRIDWKETPVAHVLKADLPGVKKEEVKVEVEEDRILQISGERSKEKEEKNDKWHRVERSSGRFLRRFRLPENAKADEVKAAMENGVLTVTVPKVEVKKPEVKSIEIAG